MKINYRKVHTFGDIVPGDAFCASDPHEGKVLCMKTEDIYDDDGEKYNAIRLDDGTFDEFLDSAVIIIPKHAEMDVEI